MQKEGWKQTYGAKDQDEYWRLSYSKVVSRNSVWCLNKLFPTEAHKFQNLFGLLKWSTQIILMVLNLNNNINSIAINKSKSYSKDIFKKNIGMDTVYRLRNK